MHDAAYYIDLLLSGVTVGSLYALIAIGYTMVYGILRLINFAHGDIFMVAGFFMVYVRHLDADVQCAFPLVLICHSGVGRSDRKGGIQAPCVPRPACPS